MIGWAVTTPAKSDDRHDGRDRSLPAHRAVFHHDAVLARRIELPGCEQEEVGSGLAPVDLRGAEDVRIEERQRPGYRERVADPVEVAVRSDAARHREGREELFDARGRGQLAGERDIDMGAECLEEP